MSEHERATTLPSGREKKVGERISILAKVQGKTQHEVAAHCGMSRISVNRFFNGHTEVRAGDTVRILQYLGIDVEELIRKRAESIFSNNLPVSNLDAKTGV